MNRHVTFPDDVLYLLAQKNVRPLHIAALTLVLECVFCVIPLADTLRHDRGTLHNHLRVGSDGYGHWHFRKGMESANLHNVAVPTAEDEVAILPEVWEEYADDDEVAVWPKVHQFGPPTHILVEYLDLARTCFNPNTPAPNTPTLFMFRC